MIMYILLFSYLIIGSILKELKINFRFQRYEILSICFLFSSSYGMGVDWMTYQRYYERMQNHLPVLNNFEVGYEYLCKAAVALCIPYELFIGIILFICNFIVLSFIKNKASDNYYISIIKIVIISLITLNFEPLIRQFIAIAIIVYAFKYIEKKSFFKYAVLVFLACCFHKTAIITFLFYFFNYTKIKIKHMIIIFIITILMCDKSIDIVKLIFNNINLLEKYNVYIDSIKLNYVAKYGLLIKQIKNIFIILPVYLYGLKLRKKNIYIYNLAFITGINIIATYIIPMFSRLNHYLFIFYAICVSALPRLEKRNIKIKILITLFYEYFIIIISFVVLYSNNVDRYRYLYYKNYFVEYIFSKYELNFENKLLNFGETIKTLLKNDRYKH